MKVTIDHWHGVATWQWQLKSTGTAAAAADGATQPAQDEAAEQEEEEEDDEDDVCGICRVAFDGCCPDCKVPGDGCPPIWGECTHVFHMHCLMKWLATESSKQQCPMDRREWVTAGSPSTLLAPDRLAAPPISANQSQDVDPVEVMVA
ncbi:hypothetical protein JCM6882_001324 [Rhodosporidiobolus microsporus]